jgi:hypothetical protein
MRDKRALGLRRRERRYWATAERPNLSHRRQPLTTLPLGKPVMRILHLSRTIPEMVCFFFCLPNSPPPLPQGAAAHPCADATEDKPVEAESSRDMHLIPFHISFSPPASLIL